MLFDVGSTLTCGQPSILRIRKAILDAENVLSPLEFQAAAGDLARLHPEADGELQQVHLSQLLAYEPPTLYRRRELAADVTLFADPHVDPSGKALIFAFCGAAHRLMMSVSVFLQLVPSTSFDVVVLRDMSRTHYLTGPQPHADAFPQLVRRLVDDVQPQRYRDVFCYGTSMGGLAALRCGLLLGRVRAISVGGRFPWHVAGLLEPGAVVLPAFDLLCACNSSRATDFVCVYGEQSEEDAQAVARLERMFPVLRRPIRDVSRHNVIFELWKQGTLRAFYSELFSSDRSNAVTV